MFKLDKDWFEILSELFINLAAGWFATVLIEPQIDPIKDFSQLLLLTHRFFLGIVSLFGARYLKEEAKKL